MKKVLPVALTVLITGGAVWGVSTLIDSEEENNMEAPSEKKVTANSNTNESQEGNGENGVIQAKLLAYTGKVQEVSEEAVTSFITIQLEDQQQTVIRIDEKSVIFNNAGKRLANTDIKEGVRITGYVDARKPSIMIYPPQYYSEVIILQDDSITGSATADFFDEDFVNTDKTLKLTVDKTTKIVDLEGKPLEQSELEKRQLIVFYDTTTRSIPAQTTPSKIIAIEDLWSKMNDAYNFTKDAHYIKSNETMIPLKAYMEQMGWVVDIKEDVALVHKGTVSYTITADETTYGYNRALGQVEVAPEIKDGEMFVPQQLISTMNLQ